MKNHIENLQPEVYETGFDPIKVFRIHTVDGIPKKGTHTTVATYEDGSFKGWATKGCQACVGFIKGAYHYDHGAPAKAVYSSLWKNPNHSLEEHKAYWNFVLNPRWSPWRSVLKDREIIEVDGVPIAYKLNDMTCPFQTMANMMFAIRMPYAQDGYLRMFNAMRKEGFTNTESLYITANIRLTKDNKLVFGYIGDYPFDTAWDDIAWTKWKEGRPSAEVKRHINTGQSYTPCNVIWSNKTSRSGDNYSDHNRKLTAIQKMLLAPLEYKGIFKKTFETKGAGTTGALGYEEAVKILKDRKSEWKVG